MGKDDNSSSAFGTVFWTILWGAVGYLTYGTVQGAVVLIAASILMGISAVLGLIPIVGVWGTWAVNNYIRTWLLSYVTLTWGIHRLYSG